MDAGRDRERQGKVGGCCLFESSLISILLDS